MGKGKRTEKLDAMRAEHQEAVEAVRADEDLTPEAKSRRVRELEADFGERFREEAERIAGGIDKEMAAVHRRAHGVEEPSRYSPPRDVQGELLKEMRLQRVRAEVYEDLVGGLDPVRAYEEARRLGDKERAAMIGRAGPGFLDDAGRKRRLRELVEEDLPEGRRRARKDLERLEREKRELEFAMALRRDAQRRRTASF